MASPQKGNGFTPIAHEILDNICRFNFNGAQLRIIMKIWRMTYGYTRKDHDFAVTFLQVATGLSDVTIKKELKYLIEKRVLRVVKAATNIKARRLAFNKNYEEWEVPEMTKKDDLEVKDSLPQDESLRYTILYPETVLEVYDTLPPDLTWRYTILTPNKEIDLKEIKIFKENVTFDYFYSIYPRKVSRQAASKAWTKLSKEKDFDPVLIIYNTLNFNETCKLLETKPNFIPHPSTYLNQKRYEDYPAVDPEGLAKGKDTIFDSNLEFFQSQLGGGAGESGSNNLTIGESSGSLPE